MPRRLKIKMDPHNTRELEAFARWIESKVPGRLRLHWCLPLEDRHKFLQSARLTDAQARRTFEAIKERAANLYELDELNDNPNLEAFAVEDFAVILS
jgi:hypothetical protein